jgi:nicotinate-nucleotide--dimethylbenzimidazole phosphoribosyltransferase
MSSSPPPSSLERQLISATSNPMLERALLDKLGRRSQLAGSLGELEPIALRLGLMQNTLKPRLREPQLLLCAADHGLAVDNIARANTPSTSESVRRLLGGRMPLPVLAAQQQLEFSVVDCGLAEDLPAHERLVMRKIAHGTRNARVGPAMSIEQAHAAIRAGMEIGDTLRGNAIICAGIGVGALESAALVLSRLTDTPVAELLLSADSMDAEELNHLIVVAQGAHSRHREVVDPVEVLAALGGFEVAVMVGMMLVAASKRHLIVVDGVPACAALLLASRIAAPVTDFCIFCRSHSHRGLDRALGLFRASALLDLGLDTTDGTGAVLSWPLLRAAAALLTDASEGDEAGAIRPPSAA